jgi:hypothetical protein
VVRGVVCGASPHPTKPGHCRRGHVLPGNAIALRSGLRRFQAYGKLSPEDRAEQAVFTESIIADKGGLADLSVIAQADIAKLGDVEMMYRLVIDHLADVGIVTPKGRPRALVTLALKLIDSWDRLAQRVGRERRARKATSLADLLKQRGAAAAAGTEGDR